MSNGNDLDRGPTPSVFEPVRDAFHYKLPAPALERLCDLAQVPAHYRPTLANSLTQLFAKAQRWHRIAARSVEMDTVAKELDRVTKAARRLKEDIDKLSPQARATLGLYALRLDQFSEADPQEAVRNQIEDLVNAGGYGHAGPKVAQLSWAAGRIEAAAATETWPRPKSRQPRSLEKRQRPEDTLHRHLQSLCDGTRLGRSRMPQPAALRPERSE